MRSKKHLFLYLLVIIFCLYVIGDYITTVFIISFSPLGIHSEVNPIVALTFHAMGEPGLLLLKLSTFIAIALVVYHVARDPNKHNFVKYMLGGLALYSSVVVGINIYTLSGIFFT